MKRITVIGAGRWGTFIAWYLDFIGESVSLYGRAGSERMRRLIETRKNDRITLPESINLTTDTDVLADSEIIVISIDSQGLRSLMSSLPQELVKNKTFVLCMKGIEIGSGLRLSEIAEQYIDKSSRVAVWLGPGHVEDFSAGRPNCMVIDSKDEDTKRALVERFSSKLIRFYYGTDLLGNEIGAAAKNVIGIAAGILDGLGIPSLKGALMARGPREISALVRAMGGNPVSVYGLCHLGDYEATVFSQYSHNRKFGELLVGGERMEALAEGYYTVCALMELGKRYNIELPICTAVYNVIYENKSPAEEMENLFKRSIKYEF